MTEAAIDPKQLAAEKTVVLSELEGDNNDNASFLSDNTRATAYQYHPYHYPIIGTKWDVEHFTRPQVYGYYRKHYAPNNATLVIVGDFDTGAVLDRVRALWRDVRPAAVPQVQLNPEPPQRGERRILVRRAGATAYLEVVYHIPSTTHPDMAPLSVLATALASGRSSRLYRALVDTQLAASVDITVNQGIDPELLDISITARAGVAPEAMEKALFAELARVQAEPLTERELQKAKNQTHANFIYAQDSVQSQASRLGFYATVAGDWRYLATYLNRIDAVTAADVQRVARTYLTADNRTVGTFLPTGEAPPPGADTHGPGERTAHYRAQGWGRALTPFPSPSQGEGSSPHPQPPSHAAGEGRAEAGSPPSLQGKGAGGLGQKEKGRAEAWFCPHPRPFSLLGRRGRRKLLLRYSARVGVARRRGVARRSREPLSGVACSPLRPNPGSPRAAGPTAAGFSLPREGSGAKTEQRRLSNGLTVIVRENHANPTVAIQGFVRAGSVDDPPGKFGLANLVAEMLARGTATRTAQQIAEEMDFVGASLEAWAGRERTDFGGRMLSGDFEAMLGLLADMVRHPTFPAEQLEKARGEILTGLQEEQDDTAIMATRRLYQALYPEGDPYRHPPAGDIEDVKRLTREDALDFYRRAYRPESTTLVIVGDVRAEAALAAVEKAFGDWKGEGAPLPPYTPAPITPAPPPSAPIMVSLADKEQGDIAMGLIGLPRRSPDYESAMLMNLILGGDEFVGRVGKRIRDTEGLAYYAYTTFVPGLEAGPWMFRAGVNPKNMARALASARDEIAKMVAQGVTEAELAWAKDHSIGALRLSLATNEGMAEELVTDAFYGLGLDYAQRMPGIVRAITRAQVNAAARKYLRPNAMTAVIAGPPLPASSSKAN